MNYPKTLPVAEIFDSVQGEGHWQGVPMSFIRLAGCNVGVIQNGIPICQSFDGKVFKCDTDYTANMHMTPTEIAERCKYPAACISGGEPFVHSPSLLAQLVHKLSDGYVHFETSGTKPIAPLHAAMVEMEHPHFVWITCCPKKDYLPENNQYISEWKFLIRDRQDLPFIEYFVTLHQIQQERICVQPVNERNSLDDRSVQATLEILRLHPEWRLSLQLHKILGVR